MYPVNHENLTQCGGSKLLVTEASSQKIPPGRPWPESICGVKLGNNMPFHLFSWDKDKAVYFQDSGDLQMIIFND